MDTGTGGRGLELATAIALGVVSVVTALGVLQAGLWNDTAAHFSAFSADARDKSVSLSVVAQLQERADNAALIEAQMLAADYDAALAAEDYEAAVKLIDDISNVLGNAYNLPEGSFEAWYAAGFTEDAHPTGSAGYLVASRGDFEALTLTSQRLSGLAGELEARSSVFNQAALVHAVSLFLFGVAGINRLRTARYVTLGVGVLVFVFGLVLMATAY